MFVSLWPEAFKAFDEAFLKYKTFILAFSGGKDSTTVAILLYKWAKEVRPKGLKVVVLHNDTLSEIPEMEEWVDYFLRQYKEKMSEIGVKVKVIYAMPRATETWYWRVFVRGYPAPTFNFRWCVDLLKIEPTLAELKNREGIVIVGARDDESGARAKSMKTRFGSCSGGGSCLGAYFTNHNDIPKLAPIRFWSYDDVWLYLKTQRDFDVSRLVELYRGLARGGSLGGRYGCWHCTLVKVQAANYYREEYLYAEAVRIIYRAVSDKPEFRTPKSTGYSKLGPLNALGRSIVLNAIRAAEELAGRRIFYGLDKARVYGYTLREIFYEIDPEEADRIIARADATDRRIPVSQLRNVARGVQIEVRSPLQDKIQQIFQHFRK